MGRAGEVEGDVAGERSEVPVVVRSEAESVALIHSQLAVAQWHRPGGGRAALAHRLAASVLLSLVNDEPRFWRLSPLVRDIVTVGADQLPESLESLATQVGDALEAPFLAVVEGVIGEPMAAERRFHEVVTLAASIAREVAAAP